MSKTHNPVKVAFGKVPIAPRVRGDTVRDGRKNLPIWLVRHELTRVIQLVALAVLLLPFYRQCRLSAAEVCRMVGHMCAPHLSILSICDHGGHQRQPCIHIRF